MPSNALSQPCRPSPGDVRPCHHVLRAGDVVLASHGDSIEATLGGCVLVVLTNFSRSVAAVAHISHGPEHGGDGDCRTDGAERAFEKMFASMSRVGIDPLDCEAYLYGGGDLMPAVFRQFGVNNKAAARIDRMLTELRIPVVDADVGGAQHRHITWRVGFDDPDVAAIDAPESSSGRLAPAPERGMGAEATTVPPSNRLS